MWLLLLTLIRSIVSLKQCFAAGNQAHGLPDSDGQEHAYEALHPSVLREQQG